MSDLMGNLMIASMSEAGSDGTAVFVADFSEAQSRVRRDPHRVGLLPPAIFSGMVQQARASLKSEFWVARLDGEVVGSIGANLSPTRPNTGYFGFFEVSLEHAGAEIARQLIEAATGWLREQGAKKIYGPITLNTWLPYRLRTDPSAARTRAYSWEPGQPSEYAEFVKAAGYSEIERYHSQGMEGLDGLLEGTRPAYDRAIASGFRFRDFDSARLLEGEVPKLYEISMKGFSDNFLFEPIPLEAFRQLYVPIANRFDFSLSKVAVSPEGEDVGFFFVFADADQLILKSIAVVPEARGKGLSNALMHLSVKQGIARGLKCAVSALVRSGAQSESYAKKAKFTWKHEYALFGKEL